MTGENGTIQAAQCRKLSKASEGKHKDFHVFVNY
jgi:hypothetical protein